MFDFICLGDATQDNFFFINEASVHCDLNGANCTLELKYGQKIPVETYAVSLGGNAANVSVGLSRLGLHTALITTFGGDNRGMWIQRQLMQNNVDLMHCAVDATRESNLSSIIVFKGERTILTYHCPIMDQIKDFPQTQWLYLTSSAGRDSKKLFAFVETLPPEIKIAFNPNMEDIKHGADFLKPILNRCEVLIINKEEAETLVGAIHESPDLLKEIQNLGPKCVVITNGKNGADSIQDGKMLHQDASKDECIEPTGAGDAFSSGFLAALFRGKTIEVAMEWGTRNAGSVIGKIGAIEGLLTKDVIVNLG